MRMFKITFYSSIAFGLIFSFFSLIFYFGDWTRLIVVFIFGLFIGMIAAPEFEPKAFNQAWIFQTLGGMLFGIALGIVLDLEINVIVIISVVCAFLGFTASYWLKHISIP